MSQSFTLLKSFSIAPLLLSAAFVVAGAPAAVAEKHNARHARPGSQRAVAIGSPYRLGLVAG